MHATGTRLRRFVWLDQARGERKGVVRSWLGLGWWLWLGSGRRERSRESGGRREERELGERERRESVRVKMRGRERK